MHGDAVFVQSHGLAADIYVTATLMIARPIAVRTVNLSEVSTYAN